jgi:hypothetical protein
LYIATASPYGNAPFSDWRFGGGYRCLFVYRICISNWALSGTYTKYILAYDGCTLMIVEEHSDTLI